MKNITVRKEEYDYCLYSMRSILKRKLTKMEIVYYWVGKNPKIHHLHLCNKNESLSINLHLGNVFTMPDNTILKNGKTWLITLPEEYDASTFIYEIIFRQDGKRPATPINTLIGVSPKKERCMRNEYRQKVKKLTRSLTRDVQNGEMPYDTAAIHFSIDTGLCKKSSLRYFRRCLLTDDFVANGYKQFLRTSKNLRFDNFTDV